jgi:UDP-N-acetylmuramoyl-L-alanyl-D-glutamate--2,6-diaminopimelate ligase
VSRSLVELAQAVGIPPSPGWEGVAVAGICEDSRRVEPGDVFVAVPGTRHDGADYIEEAIKRGAIAVVSERSPAPVVPWLPVEDARVGLAHLAAAFYDHPTRELFTVGVTGTNGKTTVCHWTAHLLEETSTTVISTVANETRGLRAVTTPSSSIVQRIAREAHWGGKQHFIVEASSIGLEQHRLDAVDFDVAVFTNLSHDHRDLHADRAAYLGAKLCLFRTLKREAYAVVNVDDRASQEVLAATHAQVVTYAMGRSADVTAEDVHLGYRATGFALCHGGRRISTCIRLPGAYNVFNALAAAGVGLCRGQALADIAERLRDVRGIVGRCQFLRRENGTTAVVDFAHNPDALEQTLRVLKQRFPRILVVFGCPGDSDRLKRPAMGAVSARFADLTVLTTDNPKTESPDAIIDEIGVGLGAGNEAVERVVDRAEAIRHAVAEARSGDVVLITGKGHETYQIVGDRFVPYSDEKVLEELGFAPDDRSIACRANESEKQGRQLSRKARR